ncbi:MAG: TolC family protein [Bacteroidales bacterium]
MLSYRYILVLINLIPIQIIGQSKISGTYPHLKNKNISMCWTLENCKNYASTHNINIKEKNINKEISHNNLKQSHLDFLPRLSIGYSHNINSSYNNGQISLNTSCVLFDSFRKTFNVKESSCAYNIAETDLKNEKINISLSVTKAYIQILLSQQILAINMENIESTQRKYNKSEKLFNSGKLAYSYLLNIKAQLVKEKANMIDASKQLCIDKLALMQLMNIPINDNLITNFTIADIEYTSLNKFYKTQDIYQQALRLPIVRISELEIEKRTYQLKENLTYFYPSISLSASYGTIFNSAYNIPYPQQISNNLKVNMIFNIEIPIFTAGANKIRVKNTKLAINYSILELKRRKMNLLKEVHQVLYEIRSLKKSIEAANSNLEAMYCSLSYTEEKMITGTVTATDYIIAKTNYNKAKAYAAQAHYQYILQIEILKHFQML